MLTAVDAEGAAYGAAEAPAPDVAQLMSSQGPSYNSGGRFTGGHHDDTQTPAAGLIGLLVAWRLALN